MKVLCSVYADETGASSNQDRLDDVHLLNLHLLRQKASHFDESTIATERVVKNELEAVSQTNYSHRRTIQSSKKTQSRKISPILDAPEALLFRCINNSAVNDKARRGASVGKPQDQH